MDDETLQRARCGDAKASRVLGRWLVGELGSFYRLYNDRELAMELSQTTALDLLSKLAELPEALSVAELREQIRRFGVVQARREATEKQREFDRASKLAAHVNQQELESPASLEAAFGQAEQHALLTELINALPVRMRESLELRTQGCTYAQIAEQLGISESTASRVVEMAMRRLEREYARARKTRSEFRTPRAS